MQNLPADWRCPTCSAEKKTFVKKGKVVAGFASNQSASPSKPAHYMLRQLFRSFTNSCSPLFDHSQSTGWGQTR